MRYWMKFKKMYSKKSMQFTISLTFTIISLIAIFIVGNILYRNYLKTSKTIIAEDNMRMVKQVELNLTSYLRNMMDISDTMYYNVIKDADIAEDSFNKEMSLLYEANKESIVNISCFTISGELVTSTPLLHQKKWADVTSQNWFTQAKAKMENLHFSTPHVENIFENSNFRYYWVVSLSRGIELTSNGKSIQGILLVDMNYSGIERLFDKVNNSDISYIYLTDMEGNIIYHPQRNLINVNLYQENNEAVSVYEDGIHYEQFAGDERMIVVKTVGYTGWKVVSVTPVENMSPTFQKSKNLWLTVIALMAVVITLTNYFISTKVTRPLRKLDDSVRKIENDDVVPSIYIGGSHEVQHLGKTILHMIFQMRKLMDERVEEQEAKRKNELDALQSQINPHFLYNTLDSIIYMVESERYEDSIAMLIALANLFRISLNQGKTNISIEEEMQHAINYIEIQKYRYKNSFKVTFDVDENIKQYETIKLIVQPLLENAIYYGMEGMGDDGEIKVKGYEKENDIFIEVSDNGLGMPEDVVSSLLLDNKRVRKKGSGIGIRNVNERIQLYFGEEYGLQVVSELDVGTTVIIHLPKRGRLL